MPKIELHLTPAAPPLHCPECGEALEIESMWRSGNWWAWHAHKVLTRDPAFILNMCSLRRRSASWGYFQSEAELRTAFPTLAPRMAQPETVALVTAQAQIQHQGRKRAGNNRGAAWDPETEKEMNFVQSVH